MGLKIRLLFGGYSKERGNTKTGTDLRDAIFTSVDDRRARLREAPTSPGLTRD